MFKKSFILLTFLILLFPVTLAIRKMTTQVSQAQTVGSDWPMFMHDPQHTGNTPATFAPTTSTGNCQLTSNQDVSPCMQIRWKKSFQEWPSGLSQPVIVGNVLYQASMDGKLYALNVTTGAEIWQFAAGSPIGVTPAVFNGIIYFGDFSGKFYALQTSNKQAAFTPFQTGGPIYSSPTVISENGVTKVFFGSNDGKFYGLNGVSGASLFSPVDTGAVIYSNPAYYNQTVFFASENMNGYAINTATGQIRWQKKLSGESNRGDHPVVLTASNTVLFYSVPRFGSTGMGLKDRWCPYGLTGGVAAVGCSEQALGDLLTNYQSKVVADPMSRSMYLFDISTGSEVTSFTAEGKSLTMIPLNLWYSNGQNFPLVLNSKDLLFGAFGGYIQLDTVSRTFTTALNYQPVRGDEYTGGSIADSWLYGGFLSNIARVKLTDKTRQQLHGCKDCGDPPPYKPFDQSPSTYHWNGYTGDGQTDFGSFFIVGSGGAYWFSNGWLYAF